MAQARYLLSTVALLVFVAPVLACGDGAGDGESTSTYTSGQKVSANNASRADLRAAFEHAQISNAEKWAREVEEYRSYPEDDLDYRKLRNEMAKYNPTPGVVDRIIAQLELP